MTDPHGRAPSDEPAEPAEPTEPIDYFSSRHPLRKQITKVALRAREAMFADFMERCRPTASHLVLDVGVTPDRTLADSNFFERLYPYKDRLTASSIEDASFLEDDHPGLRFVRTEGTTLPFDDGAFDLVFCSAVLEHVGDRTAQRHFISELTRVGRQCYLTTPNRWFPVEVHTFLPLLHWLPQPVHQRILRRLRMPFWASTDNLNLVSSRDLAALYPATVEVDVGGRRLLGLTSNLIAVSRPRRAP